MTVTPLDGKVLVADDEPDMGDLLRDILEPTGLQVNTVQSGSEALQAIQADQPDIAIVDVRMPPPDGLAVLQELRKLGVDIPVIVITAQESSTVAIEAMRRGAYDYIAKPFQVDTVLHVVERAMSYRKLSQRVQSLEVKTTHVDARDILIGNSSAMLGVYKLIGRVAESDATVLITGESGTGKELVAQVLHRSSPRREGPFIAVNCAALPETLLESELFGHEKGAFTGAIAQRKGRFEQAKGGTIFLDEIAETSPSTQKKLLRVLQERTFERVGGNVTIKADARVIAATNRNILHEIAEGRFRDDLYYRLNVVHIELPPLRDRREDIPLLVQRFVTQAARRAKVDTPRISEEAMEELLNYHWPGNVRQLENSIERAVVLSQGRPIEPAHLHLPDEDNPDVSLVAPTLIERMNRGEGLDKLLDQVKAQLIQIALQRHNGDRSQAAKVLGVSEKDLAEVK